MVDGRSSGARFQISLIAVIFFGPLLFAAWMYWSGQLRPAGTSNFGTLLDPVVSLSDALPAATVDALPDGRWILIYVHSGDCDGACREALHRMRQIRLMLGKDMERVERVFLHGVSAPDRVFLESEHPGLITTNDTALAMLLYDRRPAGVAAGGIYVIDPLANLIMYFAPELEPGDIFEDLKHLLKLSRIG